MQYLITFRKLKVLSGIAIASLLTLLTLGYIYSQRIERENTKIEAASNGEEKINDLTGVLRDIDNDLLKLEYDKSINISSTLEARVDSLKAWKESIVTEQYAYLGPFITEQKLLSQVNDKIGFAQQFLVASTPEEQKEITQKLSDNEAIIANTVKLHNFNKIYLVDANNTKKDILKKVQWMTLGILVLITLFVILVLYYISQYVSQIKQTERKLHYNASLIKNIADPIITTDKNLMITNWNEPASQLFGYTETEAVGQQLGEFMRITYPHTKMNEMMDFFVSEKDWKGEALYHHKNGTAVNVDVNSAVIKAEDNSSTGIIVVLRDRKERNEMYNQLSTMSSQLQEKVNTQNKELNVVFERVADAFMAVDNDFNYTYINDAAAKFENTSASEMIGKPLMLRTAKKEESDFYRALCRAKESQEVQIEDIYYDNIPAWYQAVMYPSQGGVSIYFRNITKEKSSQLSLQEINKRSQNFIEANPLAVAELDEYGRVIMWNKKAEELFGWGREEVIGNSITNFHIDLQNIVVANSDQSPNRQQALGHKSVASVKTKAGDFIYCQFYNTVLTNDAGRQVGTMLFAEDVTEKLQIEEALTETEAKFRNLVELSMIGVYIIQDERLAYVNPTFARIFGYEQQEMITTVSSIEIVHPSDRDKVAENVRSRIRKDVNSINYQFKGITKQGEAITVEVFGSFITYKGAPAIIGSVIDITQRIKFMEQLEDNRKAEKLLTERFLLAAKAANNAMWDWDMTTNVLWANQVFKDMLGIKESAEPFTTRDFIEFVHPEDRSLLKKTLLKSLKDRSTNAEGDFRVRTPDGSYVIIHDKAYFIYDENNWGVRVLGAFQDVTEKRNAELKIKAEKDLSDSIINSLPGVFYVIDEKGKLLRWNENLVKVTEFSDEELAGFNIQSLLNEKSIAEVKEKAISFLQGAPANIETVIRTKSGQQCVYQLTGTFINYDGKRSLMGIGIDVSERSKIQQELYKSEERYRMLIEQASDGIFITNEQGKFTSVNTSMALLTGYSKETLLAMKLEDVFHNSTKEEAQTLQQLDLGESIISEREIRKNDGSLCYAEVSYKFMIKGNFQGIVRDVTFRRAAEEALRISESKYRILFDKNPLPMFILDIHTQNFLDVNTSAQDFYGYNKPEFLGKNLFDLMEDPQNKVVLKDFGTLIKHIQKGGIYDHYKKDGTRVIVETIIHDIVYEGKSAKLIVAADETDKIKAQENLKQSHESLRQLATHLEGIREAERTHMAREIHDELGQQLTGLKMDISWLSKKLQVEDAIVNSKMSSVMKLIDKTVITVRRLATELRPSILDDLGLISALEWQTDEFEKRSEIRSSFSTNDATLIVSDNVVATNIFRIYQESLTNVLRHSEATEVHSSLTATADSLELEISDNGKGFDPNSIGNKKTLGLLGMKERVHLMGGSYNIYSKPSQGTIIKVLVPLVKEPISNPI